MMHVQSWAVAKAATLPENTVIAKLATIQSWLAETLTFQLILSR